MTRLTWKGVNTDPPALKAGNIYQAIFYVSDGDLFWVGRPSHTTLTSTNETNVILKARIEYDSKVFVYADYITWNLPRVTGLTHYSFSPNPVNGSSRDRTRESQQCQGVHLLSENGSFRCACAGAMRLTVDGMSCKSKCRSTNEGSKNSFPISMP